jgi:DNA (cytosine-5)-methyltransferase 1
MSKKLSVGSLYAGVGGICKGFENAGFKLSWANEYDKNACITYRNNFTHTLYECDVWNLIPSTVEKVDILTAGFPCQPFSVAGYRKGFSDDRGNHFFRIVEFIDEINPKVIFLENVKNLFSHDKGRTFNIIKETLDDRGYNVYSKILNTKDYGNVPHNRERVFIICILKEIDDLSFEFPEPEALQKTIQDVLIKEKVADKYYYLEDKYMYDMLKEEVTDTDSVYQWRRKYVRKNKSKVCPTLTANMGTGGHNVPLIKTDHGIRKLTPHECFELQGFPVLSGKYSLPEIANSHLYKQAGNSVSVPVISRLASNINEFLSAVSVSSKDENHLEFVAKG